MVYISKRKGFRDFIKSKNNFFYIVIFLLFCVLIAACIVIAVTKGNSVNTETQTEEISSVSSETEPATEEESLIEAIGNYRLCLNKATFCLKIYAFNEDSQTYEDTPVRSMLCGYGEDIASLSGDISFIEADSYRLTWSVVEDEYYRYTVSYSDKFVIHSAKYKVKSDKNSLDTEDYSTIGAVTVSEGITLFLADAKWIYENCSFDSQIYIYSDEEEAVGELSNEMIVIPEGITYDPTELGNDSPWCIYEVASFDCPEVINITGKTWEPEILKRISAKNSSGNSLDEYIQFEFIGYYNLNMAGSYQFHAYIVDLYGNYYSVYGTLNLINDGTMETKEAETETADQLNEEEVTASGRNSIGIHRSIRVNRLIGFVDKFGCDPN